MKQVVLLILILTGIIATLHLRPARNVNEIQFYKIKIETERKSHAEWCSLAEEY
jgi:hypothetical protein